MAKIRKVVKEGDPILRQPCVQVQRFNSTLHDLLDDMKETMYSENGVGLAAPQIGISKRIIVVDDRENGFYEMINPRIVQSKGAVEGIEFCLSVPDRGGRVIRATDVVVEYQDRDANTHQLEASDYFARIFQHEIDHLEGKLFVDVMIAEVREEDLIDEEEEQQTAQSTRRVVAKKKN